MSGNWYSPQLSRKLVSRLYFKAKAERIPMTVLINRIVEQALDTEHAAECEHSVIVPQESTVSSCRSTTVRKDEDSYRDS
jgi:hypothetical protein